MLIHKNKQNSRQLDNLMLWTLTPPPQTSITLKINGELLCMIKIFMEGVAVKDASSGVVEGVINGSLQKHLKTGGG